MKPLRGVLEPGARGGDVMPRPVIHHEHNAFGIWTPVMARRHLGSLLNGRAIIAFGQI
jgi:hypothetical protein